ncbi:tail fiber protein [Luteimonas sp. MC1828]|nr:tail fiber protein [Luteimonas sp. MC1828]
MRHARTGARATISTAGPDGQAFQGETSMFQTDRGRLRAIALLCAASVIPAASAYDAPRIESVVVMHDLDAIAIIGRNLPTLRSRMAIHLGPDGEPGDITAQCQAATPLSTAITCRFPGGLPPAGDYLLRVADTRANTETGFALTLGAVGPQGAEGVRGPAGPAGPTGATGATGAAGPQGLVGEAGSQGGIGPAGPQGEPGPQGAQGELGASGPQGQTGAIGPQGPVGLTGAIGLTGPTGASGPAGAAGPTGPVGATGTTGAPGPVGPAGATGSTGPIGPTGPEGARGLQGLRGDTGLPGNPGPQGIPGSAGPIGPAGPAGATGAPGPAGAPGPVGADGAAGPAGLAGPAGTAGATGPGGPMGPPGPQGVPGNSSLSQHYGNNTGNIAQSRTYECVLGTIILTASSYAGEGVAARGQLLSIAQNTALFALIGTTYGGDGQTTFALPDLRPVTPNNMSYMICDQGIFPSQA